MRIAVIFMIVVAATVVAFTDTARCQEQMVTDLRLEREGDFTVLTVPVNGDYLCDHFVEPPKNGKPFRIILDLCNAIHQLPQKNFAQLPAGLVQQIRTSQYKVDPEKMVRIVLDLSREATYKLSTDNVIRLQVASPDEPLMSSWAASGTNDLERASKPMSTPVQSKAKDEHPVQGQSMAHKPDKEIVTPQMQKPVLPIPQLMPEEKTKAEPPAMSHVPEEVKPAKSASAGGFDGPWVKQSGKEDMPTPMEPQVNDKPVPMVSSDQAQENELKPPVKLDPVVEHSQPIAVTQSQDKSLLERLKDKFLGAEEQPAPVLPITEDAATEKLKELAEEYDPDSPEVASRESDVKSPEPAGDPSKPLSLEEKVRMSVGGGTASFGQVDPANLAAMRGALQARLDSIARMSGTGRMGLTLTDVRPTVDYQVNITRDPFDALIEGLRSGFVGSNLPDPEALRLVGILEDWAGSIALLEDMEGYGYVLHEGDPVLNGWVTRITDESIVFQIEDYGWSHPVALRLDNSSDWRQIRSQMNQ